MRAISLDEAMTIINGCFAAAKSRRLRPLTAVVLDAGGRLKAALKQDGCAMLRFEVAYGKAYAALSMGRPSRLVLQKQREKPVFMDNLLALADGPMFLEAGGQLIRDVAGEVIGAIGVTGDAGEMDDVCVHEVRNAEEIGHVGVGGLFVECPWRSDLGDAASGHHGETVGHREGFFLVVGDIQEGDPDAFLDGLELDLECAAELGVEGSERLVQKE